MKFYDLPKLLGFALNTYQFATNPEDIIKLLKYHSTVGKEYSCKTFEY